MRIGFFFLNSKRDGDKIGFNIIFNNLLLSDVIYIIKKEDRDRYNLHIRFNFSLIFSNPKLNV